MKYILFTILCCTISIAQAQESMKGLWRVNNNNGIGLITRESPDALYQDYFLTPSISRFVGDKTLIGLDLRFIGSKYNRTNSNGTVSNTSYGLWVMPHIRQYFGNIALKPFIGSRLEFGFVGKYQTASTDRFEFEANLEGGVTYFINKHLSIDFGLEVGGLLNNEDISIDPTDTWSFGDRSNIFLSSNIYFPVSYRAQRKAINPFAYQQKGTQVFALDSKIDRLSDPFKKFNLTSNYSRHITDRWLLGGAISLESFLSRSTHAFKLFTRKYMNLPLDKLQGYGDYSISADLGYYYIFEGTNRLKPIRAYTFHNRIELGIQYALKNNIIKLGIGNSLQSVTGVDIDNWDHKLIHDIDLEIEHFWSEKVSFYAGALITPRHRFITIGPDPIQFDTNSFSQLNFGHRIYFTK